MSNYVNRQNVARYHTGTDGKEYISELTAEKYLSAKMGVEITQPINTSVRSAIQKAEKYTVERGEGYAVTGVELYCYKLTDLDRIAVNA